MAKLWKVRAVGAKTETTQNTPVSLASSDYIPAPDFSVTPVIEQLDSTVVSPALGSPANVPGLKNYDVSITYWLKGSGVVGTPPAFIDALFNASGLVSGSTGYYATSSAVSSNYLGPAESATIIGNYQGIQHAITGTVGNLKMTFEQGKKVVCVFDGKGLYGKNYDVTTPSGAFGSQIEPTVQSLAFNIGGYAFTADKFDLDFGNQVNMISDVNSANGIAGFIITDRKPVGTLAANAVNIATHDFVGRLDTAQVGTGSLTIGTVAGNKYYFTFPEIQYTAVTYANMNGLINVNATLKFNESNTSQPWINILAQ